jgi:hypothetical protein
VKPFRFILVLLAAMFVTATPGFAETRRIAVVMGNNIGAGTRPALRFAEEDATKMAQVLGELGGIAPADLFLLRGSSLVTVQEALQTVQRRVASSRQSGQTLVLFYFSGHSDGQSLELGRDRLSFADLRHWLQETGADVRLAFVDSCRSGGLLALKGGTPGPFFDIHVNDNMESTGEVLITSSAADESALESIELKGSFFSHHLMSGLRGAADVSGDGAVTLSEAYEYAFARTLSATTNTVIGPQHPNYDYRLSGRGEIVLTRIRMPAAIIELPAGFDRVLVCDAESDRVIAESRRCKRRHCGRGRAFAIRPRVTSSWLRTAAKQATCAAAIGRPGSCSAPHAQSHTISASSRVSSRACAWALPGRSRPGWRPYPLTLQHSKIRGSGKVRCKSSQASVDSFATVAGDASWVQRSAAARACSDRNRVTPGRAACFQRR